MSSLEYFITKLSLNSDSSLIEDVCVYDFNGTNLSTPSVRKRFWMVNKVNEGLKISTMIPKHDKKEWIRGNELTYNNELFGWGISLPKNISKRKTFISYYHNDDQNYRERFENLFGDLVVSKSVDDGDINSDNSDEYIKRLIQSDYLKDTTVLIVLVGAKTKCRKHVDWEISGAISAKVGGNSGLVGILLPSHPDYGTGKWSEGNLPKRLAANIESGYAKLYDWTDDRATMQKYIETAFKDKARVDDIVNNTIPQMQKNKCQ